MLYFQVVVNFLPVGHTHEDIDQVFSRLVAWLQTNAVRSVNEVKQALTKFMKLFQDKPPTIEFIDVVLDVWSWCKDHVEKLSNITKPQAFLIKMHTNGLAKLWSKQNMSDPETAWEPEFGITLIKSKELPPGRPRKVCMILL